MEKDWRQTSSANDGVESEHDTEVVAADSDSSFSYYLSNECPDKHITKAMHGLLSRRLHDWEAQEQGRESDLPTTPDGDALRIRWLIAVNPNTPSSVLETLANCACPELLERIAENPATSSVTLARLAFDPSPEVRAAVAENGNSPLETITMLARDEHADVRYRLAESYHLPVATLQELAEDDNPYVAARARITLQRIARSEIPADVRIMRTLNSAKNVFRMTLG